MAQIETLEMLIDGAWCAASDGVSFDCMDPSTGEVWATIPEATAVDVNRAVDAAEAALEGPWGAMTATQRGKHLARLADLLAAHSEEIGRIETRDTGKMFKETAWQATYIAEYLHFFAGAADKINGDTLPIDKPDMFVFTDREPLGVIAAVIPWNSQMFLMATKLGPALAAGNTMVMKGSEHASAPLLAFGKLVAQAEIPPGVVNIITGHGPVCGRELTRHAKVARVAFTGGFSAAAQVIINSAENFAEMSLELGGKSPFIVFDDANIESAVNGAVAGIFAASGQSCVAGSRLYLHADIADDFLERIVAIAKALVIGDPQAEEMEMGPLCTTGQIAHIETQVAIAEQEGGRILCGGKRIPGPGLFFEPTIIECPRQGMTIVDTELFGPILAVQRFTNEAEAIELANDTKHGLAAGLFTRDGARQIRMAKKLKSGMVWVNTYRMISPIAEFGGVKTSGHGREAGLQAMYDYTRAKTIWINLSDEPIANPFQPR